MHSADEGVESIAEMIARLVREYEARQATSKAKKVRISHKSVAYFVSCTRSRLAKNTA